MRLLGILEWNNVGFMGSFLCLYFVLFKLYLNYLYLVLLFVFNLIFLVKLGWICFRSLYVLLLVNVFIIIFFFVF